MYLTEEATGEGLVVPGLPTIDMGFAVGRLLLANFARTSAECPVLFFAGDVDQIRLWSYARSPALIRAEAVRDTIGLAPTPPGLLGYWTMDDPIDRGLCAQSLPGIRDMVSSTLSDLMHGARVMQALADDILPIDEEPVLSLYIHHDPYPLHIDRQELGNLSNSSSRDSDVANSTLGGGNGASAGSVASLLGGEVITVHLGDKLSMDAHLTDANPSDKVQLFFHMQGEFKTHPSGLVVSSTDETVDITGQAHEQESPSSGDHKNSYSLKVRWTPVVRDSGKTTEMCFVAEGQRYNPTRSGAVFESTPIRRCVTVYVPSCEVRVQRGDTLRSLAKQYQIPWRTLFLINPTLSQSGDGLMKDGQVLRIGRLFRLVSPRDASFRFTIENASSTFALPYSNLYNHNAASVFRLAAPGAMTCAASDPPETCHVRGFVDPAQHVVSDVRHSSLSQTEQYEHLSVCLVARFHSNCL